MHCSAQTATCISRGAPDPQEWLVSREVEIECRYKDMKERDIDEMVGHLLYWSTLYGIKTHKMQEEGFSKWLEYISRGPFYTLPNNDFNRVAKSIMVKYISLTLTEFSTRSNIRLSLP